MQKKLTDGVSNRLPKGKIEAKIMAKSDYENQASFPDLQTLNCHSESDST